AYRNVNLIRRLEDFGRLIGIVTDLPPPLVSGHVECQPGTCGWARCRRERYHGPHDGNDQGHRSDRQTDTEPMCPAATSIDGHGGYAGHPGSPTYRDPQDYADDDADQDGNNQRKPSQGQDGVGPGPCRI